MPYKILDKEFKTKKEITEFIRHMILKYKDNELLSDQDFAFIYEILLLHEEANIKIGPGVSSIWIQTNQNTGYGKTRGFWLKRTDGSITDFSWTKCVNTPKDSHKRDFLRACRTAIEPQIKEFRKKIFKINFNVFCPVTGELLFPHTCHIDHEAPMTFERIVSDFIVEKNIDIKTVKINEPKDGDIKTYFSDINFEKLFYDFHREKAVIQAISKQANLRMKKRPRSIK